MTTRIFHAREPDALVTRVELEPAWQQYEVAVYVRNRAPGLFLLNESDALSLASQLLGYDVTREP